MCSEEGLCLCVKWQTALGLIRPLRAFEDARLPPKIAWKTYENPSKTIPEDPLACRLVRPQDKLVSQGGTGLIRFIKAYI